MPIRTRTCSRRRGRALAVLLAALSLASAGSAQRATSFEASLLVDDDTTGPIIDRNIYGHFVEHLGRGVEEGIWVGEGSPIPNVRGIRSDVVAALRRLDVPNVRWPGGCFADTYHWRDGIGPRARRTRGVNVAWGGGADANPFGTHEFMDFLGQIGGAAAFVSVNVGSGTIREGDDWLRYMTAPASSSAGAERAANGRTEPWPVPFVGVGNESWGCGGSMTAATYAAAYRQWQTYLRTYSGPAAKLIAVGADTDDYDWTETMMARAMTWRPNPTPLAYTTDRPMLWGLSLHFYTFTGNDWHARGRNVDFTEADWARALQRADLTDRIISRHAAIMDRYDPQKKVALAVDEWGAWFDSEKGTTPLYLDSTLRDAVIAGMSLNIFNNHADRVRMANLAQMVNVIQSVILTKGDRMVVTPTFHVFEMYKAHQGARQVRVDVATPAYVSGDVRLPAISVSGSRDKGGRYHLSIVNLDPHRAGRIAATLGGIVGRNASARTITADTIATRITFDAPDPFVPVAVKGVAVSGDRLTLTVPAKSVTMVEIR